MALAAGPGQGRSTEEVFGYGYLVIGRRLVVLEALGEFVGVIKDVLYGAWHGCHLKNFWRGEGRAAEVAAAPDVLGHADLIDRSEARR